MAKSRARRCVGVAVFVLAATFGCSPDEPDEPVEWDAPPPLTLVSGKARLRDLNDNDAERLCRDVQTFNAQSGVRTSQLEWTRRICALHYAALIQPTTEAESRQECQANYDEICDAPGVVPDLDEDCRMLQPGCSATVDEYQACLETLPHLTAQQLDTLPTCEELTLADLGPDAQPTIEQPAACIAFEAICPDYR